MVSFWLEFEQAGELRQVPFEGESISIGRDRSSDFVLDHPTVSRQHALIVHQGGGSFQLVVLSRGGLTAVDGQPAQTQEVALYDSSMITLGQYTLRFCSDYAQPRPAGFGSQPGFGPTPAPLGRDGQSGFGGAASSQNFGQQGFGGTPAPQDQSGFGQQGFGQQGLGQQGFGGTPSPQGQSGFGQPMGGMGQGFGAADPQKAPKPEEKKPGHGIATWDEIAASSSEEEDVVVESDFDRIRKAKQSGKKDESNPALVFGGLALAVGMVLFAVLAGGSGKDDNIVRNQVVQDTRPVEIEVSCLDDNSCRRQALQTYERAVNLLERRDVETGNLFEGYKRLLEAQAYLERGNATGFPDEMSDWQRHHDEARAELDRLFGLWRREFHNAATLNRYDEMAEILQRIEAYYPDRTAYERRWARDRELEMQAAGIYPRRFR